jgi:hypothetical protein
MGEKDVLAVQRLGGMILPVRAEIARLSPDLARACRDKGFYSHGIIGFSIVWDQAAQANRVTISCETNNVRDRVVLALLNFPPELRRLVVDVLPPAKKESWGRPLPTQKPTPEEMDGLIKKVLPEIAEISLFAELGNGASLKQNLAQNLDQDGNAVGMLIFVETSEQIDTINRVIEGLPATSPFKQFWNATDSKVVLKVDSGAEEEFNNGIRPSFACELSEIRRMLGLGPTFPIPTIG